MSESKLNIDFTLVGKILAGDASPDEIRSVDKWRLQNPENELEFNRLVKLWNESGHIVTNIPSPVNIDAAWIKLQHRIHTDDAQIPMVETKIAPVRSLFYYASRIAAAVIVGVLLFVIYNRQLKPTEQKEFLSENIVTETRLEDNTKITLNENSKITYPEKFNKNKREVKLTGEAFFEVKRNEEKPFVIDVDEAIIEVLGTSFNVRAIELEPDISVTVQEGKVRFSDKEDIAFVILEPNEKGILNKETGNIEKYTLVDGSEMFWKTKTLMFRDTQLETVFKTLERVFDIEISTENKDILKCELSGKFQDVSIDEILENIALNFNLSVTKENNIFKITGNGC